MTSNAPIKLIINADDYGYFPCVSQGILAAAASGAVTATGILANSPNLQKQLDSLDTVSGLDLGVHLNLTFGQPLTTLMAEKLGGIFPGVYRMSQLILTGKVGIDVIRDEWRAQIEACNSKKLSFLNSHEHIHMLPNLFSLTQELARECGIPHVRLTRADWSFPCNINSIIRDSLIGTMATINRHRSNTQAPVFLGLSSSGKLNIEYLAKLFSTLKPGKIYELMCHPGFFEPDQISDPRLMHYHDWVGELALLQSQQIRDLYENFGILLCRYGDVYS